MKGEIKEVVLLLALSVGVLPINAAAAGETAAAACSDSQSKSTAYSTYQLFNDYDGVVAGKPIGMTLIFHGSRVNGQVFVAPNFRDIVVKGEVGPRGELTLNTVADDPSGSRVFHGQFKDSIYCESLDGGWDQAVDGIPAKGWSLRLGHTGSADEGKNYYSRLGVTDDRQIDDNALALQRAILAIDKQAVAKMVDYPLPVLFGRKSVSIKDATQFIQAYDQIFIPPMLDEISAAIPHHMFTDEDGALMTSTIWLDDSGKLASIDVIGGPEEDRNIYETNYICDTTKLHIVIDSKADEVPRYRAWVKPHPLTVKPDMEIDSGSETVEGTGVCDHSIWSFKKGDTQFEVSQLGCTEGSEPSGAVGQLEITIRGELKETLWCMGTGQDSK